MAEQVVAAGAEQERQQQDGADPEPGDEERQRVDVLDGVLHDDERRPEEGRGARQRQIRLAAQRSETISVAQPGKRLVMGMRRSRPNALSVTRTPMGACRRFHSAMSIMRAMRRTMSGS
jgi:hypothetical protein